MREGEEPEVNIELCRVRPQRCVVGGQISLYGDFTGLANAEIRVSVGGKRAKVLDTSSGWLRVALPEQLPPGNYPLLLQYKDFCHVWREEIKVALLDEAVSEKLREEKARLILIADIDGDEDGEIAFDLLCELRRMIREDKLLRRRVIVARTPVGITSPGAFGKAPFSSLYFYGVAGSNNQVRHSIFCFCDKQ